jgi:hypothetical protein
MTTRCVHSYPTRPIASVVRRLGVLRIHAKADSRELSPKASDTVQRSEGVALSVELRSYGPGALRHSLRGSV